MTKTWHVMVLAMGATALLCAQETTSVVHGTITKVDAAARTVVVATANGTEEVIQFGDKTVVHGTDVGAKDAFHGLKQGAEVAAHCATVGGKKTAVEVDNLSKGGLKAAEGTIAKVDAGTKTVVVKTADGTEQAFDMTGHAAADVGKATAKGAQTAGKVTVYYTEEGGKKIAHFFRRH